MIAIEGYVWCHEHGCIHDDDEDPYGLGTPECDRIDHDPVYMKEQKMSITKPQAKDMADEIMAVRDRLMVLYPDTDEEQQTLLKVRDRITAIVDEMEEPKPKPASKPRVQRRTDSTSTEIGAAIREKRQDLGMSRKDLAEKAGISVVSLRKIELGETKRPHGKTLNAIEGVTGTALPRDK